MIPTNNPPRNGDGNGLLLRIAERQQTEPQDRQRSLYGTPESIIPVPSQTESFLRDDGTSEIYRTPEQAFEYRYNEQGIGETLSRGLLSAANSFGSTLLGAGGSLIGLVEGDLSGNNSLTRTSQLMMELDQQYNPIYDFDPNEFTASDLFRITPSAIGSGAGFLVPGAAIARGIGYATKVLGVGQALNAISPVVNQAFQQGVGGLALRHMESYMEASSLYNQTRDRFIANPELITPAARERIGQELSQDGIEATDENIIEYIAGQAALTTYQQNYANLAFDILQMGPLVKSFGRSSDNVLSEIDDVVRQRYTSGQAIGDLSSDIQDAANRFTQRTRLNNWLDYGANPLSEGLEEMVNNAAQLSGNQSALSLAQSGIESNNGLFGNLAGEGSLESFVGGLIGGGAFAVGGGISERGQLPIQREQTVQSTNRLVESYTRAQDRLNQFSTESQQIESNLNLSPEEREVELASLRDNYLHDITMEGILNKNLGVIKSIAEADDLTTLGQSLGIPEAQLEQIQTEAREKVKQTTELYKQASRQLANVPEEVKNYWVGLKTNLGQQSHNFLKKAEGLSGILNSIEKQSSTPSETNPKIQADLNKEFFNSPQLRSKTLESTINQLSQQREIINNSTDTNSEVNKAIYLPSFDKRIESLKAEKALADSNIEIQRAKISSLKSDIREADRLAEQAEEKSKNKDLTATERHNERIEAQRQRELSSRQQVELNETEQLFDSINNQVVTNPFIPEAYARERETRELGEIFNLANSNLTAKQIQQGITNEVKERTRREEEQRVERERVENQEAVQEVNEDNNPSINEVNQIYRQSEQEQLVNEASEFQRTPIPFISLAGLFEGFASSISPNNQTFWNSPLHKYEESVISRFAQLSTIGFGTQVVVLRDTPNNKVIVQWDNRELELPLTEEVNQYFETGSNRLEKVIGPEDFNLTFSVVPSPSDTFLLFNDSLSNLIRRVTREEPSFIPINQNENPIGFNDIEGNNRVSTYTEDWAFGVKALSFLSAIENKNLDPTAFTEKGYVATKDNKGNLIKNLAYRNPSNGTVVLAGLHLANFPSDIKANEVNLLQQNVSISGGINLDSFTSIVTEVPKLVSGTINNPLTEKEKREVTNWFKRTFPDIPLEITSNVLSYGGNNAWALFRQGMVILNEGAPSSTIYHEAFHVALRMSVSNETYSSIIKEGRDKYNLKGTDTEVEEQLADLFEQYLLTEDDSTLTGRIKRFFKQLLNWVRSFLNPNIDSYNINQLFEAIQFGNKNLNRLTSRMDSFYQRYKDSIATKKINGVTIAENELFITEGSHQLVYIDSLIKDSRINSGSREQLKTKLRQLVDNSKPETLASIGYSEEDVATIIANKPSFKEYETDNETLDSIIDSFQEIENLEEVGNIIKPLFWNSLIESRKSTTKETTQNILDKVILNFEGENGAYQLALEKLQREFKVESLEDFIWSTDELNRDWTDKEAAIKDSMSDRLKRILKLLPEQYIDSEGNVRRTPPQLFNEGYKYLDFNSTYATLEAELVSKLNWDSMKESLQKLGSINPTYNSLLKKLNEDKYLRQEFIVHFTKVLQLKETIFINGEGQPYVGGNRFTNNTSTYLDKVGFYETPNTLQELQDLWSIKADLTPVARYKETGLDFNIETAYERLTSVLRLMGLSLIKEQAIGEDIISTDVTEQVLRSHFDNIHYKASRTEKERNPKQEDEAAFEYENRINNLVSRERKVAISEYTSKITGLINFTLEGLFSKKIEQFSPMMFKEAVKKGQASRLSTTVSILLPHSQVFKNNQEKNVEGESYYVVTIPSHLGQLSNLFSGVKEDVYRKREIEKYWKNWELTLENKNYSPLFNDQFYSYFSQRETDGSYKRDKNGRVLIDWDKLDREFSINSFDGVKNLSENEGATFQTLTTKSQYDLLDAYMFMSGKGSNKLVTRITTQTLSDSPQLFINTTNRLFIDYQAGIRTELELLKGKKISILGHSLGDSFADIHKQDEGTKKYKIENRTLQIFLDNGKRLIKEKLIDEEFRTDFKKSLRSLRTYMVISGRGTTIENSVLGVNPDGNPRVIRDLFTDDSLKEYSGTIQEALNNISTINNWYKEVTGDVYTDLLIVNRDFRIDQKKDKVFAGNSQFVSGFQFLPAFKDKRVQDIWYRSEQTNQYEIIPQLANQAADEWLMLMEKDIVVNNYQKLLADFNILPLPERGEEVEYEARYNLLSQMLVQELRWNQLHHRRTLSNFTLGHLGNFKNLTDAPKRAKTDSSPAQLGSGIWDENGNYTEEANQIRTVLVIDPKAQSSFAATSGIDNEEDFEPGEIDRADAQVWVTPSFYKKFLMSQGQWKKEYDEVNSLVGRLFNGEELTASEIRKVNRQVPNIFNPLKTFYIDKRFDRNTLEQVSRNVKLSMSIIWPQIQLFEGRNIIAGDAEVIMVASAAKFGWGTYSTLFTKEGQLLPENEKSVNTFFTDIRNWAQQQIVPVHLEDTTNKLASQLRKHVISNIKENGRYSVVMNNQRREITGRELVQEYGKLVDDLINEQLNVVLSKYSLAGEGLMVDWPKLKTELIKQLAIRDNDESIEAVLSLENGDEISLDFPAFGGVYEQLVLAPFQKQAIELQVPGFSAVMVSDVGVELKLDDFNEDGTAKNGSISIDTQFLKEQRELKYTVETLEDGSKLYVVEAFVPAYSKAFFDKKNQSIVSFDRIDNGVLRHLEYRIPNEGKYSTLVIKPVGILGPSFGGSVIVAKDVIPQTGADFDIDKLYALTRNLKQDKEGRVIEDNNSKKKKTENQIYHLMESVFGNTNHLNESRSSSNFDRMKDFNKKMKKRVELEGGFASDYDPQVLHSSSIASDNAQAKSGIGTPANILSTFGVAQALGLKIIDHQNNLKLEFSYDITKEKGTNTLITDGLKEYLAAILDMAKDPQVSYWGGNEVTIPTSMVMVMSSLYSLEDTFRISGSRIVRDYTEKKVIAKNGKFSSTNSPQMRNLIADYIQLRMPQFSSLVNQFKFARSEDKSNRFEALLLAVNPDLLNYLDNNVEELTLDSKLLGESFVATKTGTLSSDEVVIEEIKAALLFSRWESLATNFTVNFVPILKIDAKRLESFDNIDSTLNKLNDIANSTTIESNLPQLLSNPDSGENTIADTLSSLLRVYSQTIQLFDSKFLTANANSRKIKELYDEYLKKTDERIPVNTRRELIDSIIMGQALFDSYQLSREENDWLPEISGYKIIFPSGRANEPWIDWKTLGTLQQYEVKNSPYYLNNKSTEDLTNLERIMAAENINWSALPFSAKVIYLKKEYPNNVFIQQLLVEKGKVTYNPVAGRVSRDEAARTAMELFNQARESNNTRLLQFFGDAIAYSMLTDQFNFHPRSLSRPLLFVTTNIGIGVNLEPNLGLIGTAELLGSNQIVQANKKVINLVNNYFDFLSPDMRQQLIIEQQEQTIPRTNDEVLC